MYRNIYQRIKRENKKLIIESPIKCSFFIDIQKQDVNFYFIVPIRYLSLIKEKIASTWSKVTIEEVNEIKMFSVNASKYQLNYKKEDALSLNIDKKCNEPLNSILNVVDIMKEEDRVGIFYNFIPFYQLAWNKQYQDTIDKIKESKPIDKEKFNFKYIIKEIFIILINILQDFIDILNDFTGTKSNKNIPTIAEIALTNLVLEDKKKLSKSTVNKKDDIILSTQIMIVSDSKDKGRKENNVISVLESYKTISEDNELIYKKIKNKKRNNFYITDFKIPDVEENKMSIEECQNFIQLPGRSLLQEHKMINKIDTLESEVPKELQEGVMCIGENKYKNKKQKAFLSTDREFKFLTLCLIAPTRAGKTTLIGNLNKNAIDNGECSILFDFCGNCELSDEISEVISKKKILNIDCSDFDTLQGLGYNEIQPLTDNVLVEILSLLQLYLKVLGQIKLNLQYIYYS